MVAFFPVPALVALVCFFVDHKADAPILLTMPQIINLYTESHFLDPQRDFLDKSAGQHYVHGRVHNRAQTREPERSEDNC